MQVSVPPGVQPGQPVQVQVSGRAYQVNVPAGVAPGQAFHVQVPVAQPQAAQPMMQQQQQQQVMMQQPQQQTVVHHHQQPAMMVGAPMYGHHHGGMGVGMGLAGGMMAGAMMGKVRSEQPLDGSQGVRCTRCCCAQMMDSGFGKFGKFGVSHHDIVGIWVAFFSRCQRYRCGQG